MLRAGLGTAKMTDRLASQWFALLRRTMGIVWQGAPVRTGQRVALALAQGVIPAVSIYLTKLTVDAITANPPDFRLVLGLMSALGCSMLVGFFVASLARIVAQTQEQAVTDHVLSLVHAKSVALDLAHYEDPGYHDVLHRAQRDAQYRSVAIVSSLGGIGQHAVTFGSLVALLVTQNWIIAGVFVLAAVPGTFVRLRYAQRQHELYQRETPSERRWLYFHWLLTLENYVKEVRLFGLGTLFVERALALRRALTVNRLQFARKRTAAEFAAEIPGGLAVFASLVYLVRQALDGIITIGELLIFYQAFQAGYASVRELLGALVRLYEDSLFLENLFEFLDLEPCLIDATAPRSTPRPIRQGLAFEHVRFEYARSDRPVLDDLTLTIRPGEHIALVGANGAGKSTFVKLLCRLYDPTAGRITLDGVDLREYRLSDLRRQIGVVFQDHGQYNLTARENIWLGDTSLDPGDPRIEAAAGAAGAESVIRKLRHGYETRLGKWFDDDQEISIGEWQKIAIARMFVGDAQIVVLDEPTSALDASSEYEVFQKFQEIAAHRTTVVISHRFSTVRTADRIYVLTNGRIAEAGSHAELMRQGGEYARMFELQASSYR